MNFQCTKRNIRKNLDPKRGCFATQPGANTEKKIRKKKLKLTLKIFSENHHIQHGRTSAPSFRKIFIYLFIYLFIFEKYFFSLIALLWQQSRGLFQGPDFS